MDGSLPEGERVMQGELGKLADTWPGWREMRSEDMGVSGGESKRTVKGPVTAQGLGPGSPSPGTILHLPLAEVLPI